MAFHLISSPDDATDESGFNLVDELVARPRPNSAPCFRRRRCIISCRSPASSRDAAAIGGRVPSSPEAWARLGGSQVGFGKTRRSDQFAADRASTEPAAARHSTDREGFAVEAATIFASSASARSEVPATDQDFTVIGTKTPHVGDRQASVGGIQMPTQSPVRSYESHDASIDALLALWKRNLLD